MVYDLVIRGGMIVDGSGAAPYFGDVAVAGGRIAAVGILDQPASSTFDADGLAVTPGFIDGHTHMDAQVMWDPIGSSSCWHGVTSVVMGNCGFSLAPVRADARSLVVRNLERAEDISAAAMNEGIDWTWESFPECLDAVDRRPKVINYAAYVGHSALRTWAMGERAFEDEATDDDVTQMQRQLEVSLDAGAIGLSTSRSANHETSDDRPVASRQATWEEVCRLVAVLARKKRGLFELALEPAARSVEDHEFLDRLSALAIGTGVPTTFGVLAGRDEHLLPFIRAVSSAGGSIFGQSHCRGVAGLLSFLSTLPFDGLPVWREVRALPAREQLRALSDPIVREGLISSADVGPYPRAVGSEARKPDYERLYIMSAPLPPYESVADRAGARGMRPVEIVIDLAIETDLRQFFVQPLSDDDPSRILPFLTNPDTVMTFSDSGAHVRQIADSSLATHLLAYWARQRQDFSLAQGVRMLTAIPAQAWGLGSRGALEAGKVADINIFDPREIKPAMPEVSHDLPANAGRLRQRAVGIRATFVAGQLAFLDGEHTGALPGRLIRNGGLRPVR